MGWHKSGNSLTIWLDLIILPGHPDYTDRKEGEFACFKEGALVFDNISAIQGLLRMVDVAGDQSGEDDIDFSDLDGLWGNGPRQFYFSGELGEVFINSDHPDVCVL